jgi:hypothetical protein
MEGGDSNNISIWFSRCGSSAPTSIASVVATRSRHALGFFPTMSRRCSRGAPPQLPKLLPVFEELRGLGYEGGDDAVRRYARVWR